MSEGTQHQDPMDFLKNMWGNMGFTLPGMVTPTLDVDELDKRITDMKAVEGWLKMNLSGLQMTIQGLEMQRHTIAAFKAMSQTASANNAESTANANANATNPFANPALWPWNVMTQAAAAATAASTPQAATGATDSGSTPSGSTKTTKSDDRKKSA
jgi:hypothetical protein